MFPTSGRKRTLWVALATIALVATPVLGMGTFSGGGLRGHAQAAPDGVVTGPGPVPNPAPAPGPSPGEGVANGPPGTRTPKVATLDLANGSLVPGNHPGTRGGLPSLQAYDGPDARVFVAEFSYGTVGVISTRSHALVGSIPASYPNALAYDPTTDVVFIGLQLADAVEVANASSLAVLGTTYLATEPLTIAVDPASGAAFVSSVSPVNDSGNLAELNGSTGAVETTVPVVPFPSGVAFDGSNDRLYVTSGVDGNVSIVNATSSRPVGTGHLPFVPGPTVYVPAVHRLFVANSSGADVSVVRPLGLHVQATVALPSTGAFLATDANGTAVYVGDFDSVTVLSTATDTVAAEFPQVHSPDGLSFDAADADLYVSDEAWDNVSVVNAATGAVLADVLLGAAPYDLAYDGATGDFYVADLESSGLIVVNATHESVVGRIPLDSTVYGLAYDPRTHDLYADDYYGDNVSVIDPTSGAVLADIGVGTNPWGIALDAANHDLYVTNPGSDNISVISPRTDAVVASIGAGMGAGPVAYDPVSHLLFVGEYDSGNVTILNGTTNAIVGSVGAGTEPYAISVDAATGDVFVGNYASANVTVLSANGSRLVAGIPVGSEPFAATYDPLDGDVYVADFGSDAVRIVNTATFGVGETVAVGVGPVAAASDPRTGQVFVSDYDSGSLTILATRIAPFPHFALAFRESGLPAGTLWNVSLDGGTPIASTTGRVAFLEPNGTYDYAVGAIPGYRTAYLGVAYVEGATVVHLHFTVASYRWVSVPSGLPAGTEWTVTVGARTYSGNGSKIVVYIENGTYNFTAASAGYSATPGSGTTTVSGTRVVQAILFS